MMYKPLSKLARGYSMQVKCVQTQMQLPPVPVKSQQCYGCKYFNAKTFGCKAFSIINHQTNGVKEVSTGLCRTREDLCGEQGSFFIDSSVEIVPSPEHFVIQYYIDGSSTIADITKVSVDEYYENIAIEFNDVY